jgi:porphyrinogen peroxidase
LPPSDASDFYLGEAQLQGPRRTLLVSLLPILARPGDLQHGRDAVAPSAADRVFGGIPMEPEVTTPSGVVPQPVAEPLTRAAIFLVATVNNGGEHLAAVRGLCPGFASLVRAIAFRDLAGRLACTLGIGSDLWGKLFGSPKPAELRPFREIRAGARHAVATPGDLLLHIRAERMDLCFELAQAIMSRLGPAVSPADEVQGFGYFDQRDLLGFVDGTENPAGEEALAATLVGDEDPAFAGGTYIIVQKYLHDLAGWNVLPTEMQERIIGRGKLSDVELDAAQKPSWAHNELNKIVENGREIKILRANMAFGRPGSGEYGTYYIAYARSPRTIEQMLENMFIGKPPGNYDRILDFSRAVTGSLFFAPSATFLENITPDEAANVAREPSEPAAADGSLGIGSLKGDSRHE